LDDEFEDEFSIGNYEKNPELARVYLLTLTEKERTVLSIRCKRRTYRYIAKKLSVSKKTVEFHLGNIYKKLKLNEVGMGYNERLFLLASFFCPTLRELIAESPEEAPTQIAEFPGESLGEIIPSDPQIQAIVQMESQFEAAMDDDEPIIIDIKPPPPIIRPQLPSGQPKKKYGWLFWLVLILAIGVGGFLLGQRFPIPFAPQPTPESSQTGEAALPKTPTATQKPAEQVVVEPTATTSPAREFNAPPVKPTIVPSSTPTLPPTDTLPPPTDTPIPTPTPIFKDDFNTGQNPAWDIPDNQLGELFWVSETVTVTGKVWMYVGSTEWTDYEVVIDANVTDSRERLDPNSPHIFALRVVDKNNFIAFQYNAWGATDVCIIF